MAGLGSRQVSTSLVALAFGALLAGCGGESPPQAGGGGSKAGAGGAEGQGGAITSADPAVAGPAVHAELVRALKVKDAKALIGMLSESMHEQGLEHARELRADLEKDPAKAERAKQALGLPRSPLELSLEELLELDLAQRLRDPKAVEGFDIFGYELIEARALGERLLLRGRVRAEKQREVPGGVAQVVFVRQGGRWRLDEHATDDHISGYTRTITLPEGSAEHVAFTPDGRHLVTSGSHGIHVLPFEGDGPRLHVPAPWASEAYVAGDGTWVLTTSQGGELPRPEGEEPAPEVAAPEGEAPAPPPDPHRGIVLWRLPGGERMRAIAPEPAWPTAISPSGRLLALIEHGEAGPRVVVVELPEGTRRAPIDIGEARVLAFVGEDALAVQGEAPEVRIHALDGKRRLTVPTERVESSLHLAANRASTQLAVLGTTVTKGLTERHVALYDLAEGEELWRANPGYSDHVRFSPDGTEVTTGENTLKRYDAATGALVGGHRRTSERHTGAFAWHPSGRWLVCAAHARDESGRSGEARASDVPRPWVAHVYEIKR